MTHNVLQLGEVAEIEAQMFSFAQKFNRRTELEFSTELAILPNCCYAFVVYLSNNSLNIWSRYISKSPLNSVCGIPSSCKTFPNLL